MLGTDKEPGIYVRTLNDLFRAIEETSDDMQYSVSMSYLEVSPLSWKSNPNPNQSNLTTRATPYDTLKHTHTQRTHTHALFLAEFIRGEDQDWLSCVTNCP